MMPVIETVHNTGHTHAHAPYQNSDLLVFAVEDKDRPPVKL